MPLSISTSSRQQPLHINVFGPPGRGKTSSLIMASAKCPEGLSHLVTKGASRRQAALVTLDDLLMVPFEPSATVGWKQLNIEAPELDLSTLNPMDFPATKEGYRQFERLFQEAHALIATAVSKGTRVVCIDGPTFFDGLAQEAVGHFFPNEQGPQFWGQVNQVHRDWLLPLQRIPAIFVHIFHADSKSADMGGKSDAAQALKEAQELKRKAWGMADIFPRISGGAKALYRGVAALNVYADRGMQMSGGKMVDGYWFFTESNQYDTKRRFELDAVEPADWRVVFGKMGLTAR